jgi:anti-anti-sigma factor
MSTAAPGPVLTIDTKRCTNNTVIIYCHGRLVAGVTDVLTTGVCQLLPDTKRIILDLTDLKHTDSMGLGTLVRLYVSAKSAGSSLELVNLSKQIQHLLGLTHMLSVFTVIGENGIKFM